MPSTSPRKGEKDEIGRCALYKENTPTPKGGTFGAFCILPQWRRKGYGSYLLKEALRALDGYDREQATVFTAPLPTDPGEAAFWAKFDFQPEGTQLVRRRTPDLTAVRFVQDFLAARLTAPRLCIDATCGNGGIRRSCASAAGAGGCWALTSSPKPLPPPEPIWRKKALRQSFTATATPTSYNMLRPGTVDAVMFNFGWLPGADHGVFSTAGSSIPALEAALQAVRPGGVVSAILYSGDGHRHRRKNGHPPVDALPAPETVHRPCLRLCQLG